MAVTTTGTRLAFSSTMISKFAVCRLFCMLLAVWPWALLAADSAQVPIQIGDVIHVDMEEDPEVMFHGPVEESGFIRLPFLREFRVVGKTEGACAQALKDALEAELYQRATLNVRIVRRAAGVVYVYGAVKEPGAVALPELGEMTVLQALAKVKGVTAWAAPDVCQVTRFDPANGEREKIRVNLIDAFKDIGGEADIKLRANDVVFVSAKSAEITQILSNEPYEIIVVGQVNAPGIMVFAPGELRTFMRAIFKAGNFTRFAKKKAVRLIRYGRDGKREVREVNAARMIDDGFLEEDFELQAGDMIIVDEKMINF